VVVWQNGSYGFSISLEFGTVNVEPLQVGWYPSACQIMELKPNIQNIRKTKLKDTESAKKVFNFNIIQPIHSISRLSRIFPHLQISPEIIRHIRNPRITSTNQTKASTCQYMPIYVNRGK